MSGAASRRHSSFWFYVLSKTYIAIRLIHKSIVIFWGFKNYSNVRDSSDKNQNPKDEWRRFAPPLFGK
jgi:hypothetical protein